MFPFLPEYAEQMIVPILTGVTGLTVDSGEVIILDFGQGLWFVNRIENSLINPNHCQKDQLVGSSRTFILTTSSMNVKIFSYHMNLIRIDQIFLFWISSTEEEYRTGSNFH